MYNLLLYIYELGVIIACIFSPKVRKMWRGECEAFTILKNKVEPDKQYAWFHAASLGEFEQGRPIIEKYRKAFPEHKILLTFFSPSGYEVRKNYELADIICYLPIDTPTNVSRFFSIVQPTVAFIIKYEFWYNYFHTLSKLHVPIYSVSSIFRPEQIFFKWYGRQYRRVLKCVSHFFVQNEQSKLLLEKIGISDVSVTGDTRFDRVAQIALESKDIPVVEQFKDGKKVFIAGSSWPADEQIFLSYLAEHPEWKVVIAPHVIGESHLQQIMSMLGTRKTLRYTEIKDPNAPQLKEAEVLIIDCFGLLSSIYRYGDIAYVGGGFGVGIHNLPEAAVWNIPVIFGPNHQKFQEAHELKACGGGFAIADAADFKEVMDGLSQYPERRYAAANAAGNYVKSNSGATEKVLNTYLKQSRI